MTQMGGRQITGTMLAMPAMVGAAIVPGVASPAHRTVGGVVVPSIDYTH
jgi:hypothetical protein